MENKVKGVSPFEYTKSRNATYLSELEIKEHVRKHITGVFSWMFIALGLSALVAWLFANTPALLSLLITDSGGASILFYVLMLAPLGIVLLFSAGLTRFSIGVLSAIFILNSAVIGVSFSIILLTYTSGSILTTFLITSVMFGTMAVVGYTTKKDLTAFGSLLRMALIGLIVATIINIFMGSELMDYVISFIGVAVFTGLTAYDMQKIKNTAYYTIDNPAEDKKLKLVGALALYLDFINLFLMLLRLFGSRD